MANKSTLGRLLKMAAIGQLRTDKTVGGNESIGYETYVRLTIINNSDRWVRLITVRHPQEICVATEIERKFLVDGADWRETMSTRISQGYLNRDKNRTVRVRVAGEHAYLTVKGATSGATRAEFEYEIPVADAEQLITLCEGPIIQKVRRLVLYRGYTWEVDEFLGENAGLVVAEIELQSEDQEFPMPPWISREVTEDPRYFNSNLATNPYCTWRDKTDS